MSKNKAKIIYIYIILAEQQPVGRWAATRGSTGWIKAGTRVDI